MGSARRTLRTAIGLMVLRRRLQRRGGPAAAVALLGLEILGPNVLRLRRLLVWALALTIVGGIVAAVIWWWLRSSGDEPEPIPPVTMPAPQPAPPPTAVAADGA